MALQVNAAPKTQWLTPSLMALPGLYSLVVILTAVLSPYRPGGTYYRIIGIDPLAGAFMVVLTMPPRS
jgi:hypothetical protein